MKTEVTNSINDSFNKISFALAKHSPEILIVAGVIGTVASAVIACRATTKLGDILTKSKKAIDLINEHVGDESLSEPYSEEDAKKDLVIVYTQTGVALLKLYAPAVIFGALSITSIIASHSILRKRNVALAAAYATIDKGFKEYRNRVLERFGKEVDHELRHNVQTKKFETVVDENGEEKKSTVAVNVVDIGPYSGYARFFDNNCPEWRTNHDYNMTFLRMQQQYANDLLRVKGRLFLNEVYDMLGIPMSKAGQIVGWVYDKENSVGDNFVDFGISNVNREIENSVNGYASEILLDFNVDGNVWYSMKEGT